MRSLQKNTQKSTHPDSNDMQLCLSQLLKGDEADDPSEEWTNTKDRGGLCHVSNDTYELFLALEKEFRKYLTGDQLQDLTAEMKQELKENENIQFIWYIISADWASEISSQLLNSIIAEWVKIRGFSLAVAWVEKYKAANKKTTEKSKGVRKQLLST